MSVQTSALRMIQSIAMMQKRSLVLAAAVLAGGCAAKSTEQRIVEDAAIALGGRSRILAVKTIVLEGEGTNGNLGQDMTMEATGQAFVLAGYKRSIAFANARARTEQTRTPNLVKTQGS